MTEQELVERCREGERQAQREVYDSTSQRIYRLLLRMTGNADDAFDLAQETYLKAFSQIGRFDGRSALATWLYRIAVNEALQFRRRAARERSGREAREIEPVLESGTERTAISLDVADALSTLPADDRAILLLRYQEGLDYRTIEEVLDCASGTVASRLNRARQRLRDILQKSYGPREDEWAADHPKIMARESGAASNETGGPGAE